MKRLCKRIKFKNCLFFYLVGIELKKNVILFNGYSVFILQNEKSAED